MANLNICTDMDYYRTVIELTDAAHPHDTEDGIQVGTRYETDADCAVVGADEPFNTGAIGLEVAEYMSVPATGLPGDDDKKYTNRFVILYSGAAPSLPHAVMAVFKHLVRSESMDDLDAFRLFAAIHDGKSLYGNGLFGQMSEILEDYGHDVIPRFKLVHPATHSDKPKVNSWLIAEPIMADEEGASFPTDC